MPRCFCTPMALSIAILVGGFAFAADKAPDHAAVKPVQKDKDENWKKRHEGFVAIAKKGEVDVLFVGDAQTEWWGLAGERDKRKTGGKDVWEKEFKNWKAAQFGIGGDFTQHLLWRLQNGELDGIAPKVVVLLIGTNNTNGSDFTSEQIADGITAIVKEIHTKSPKSKVLLLGVFPRQKNADDPRRDKIKKINDIIKKLDDEGKTVKYLDIGDKFLEKDGSISPDIMHNYVHLTEKGYEIWAAAIKKTIEEMMKP